MGENFSSSQIVKNWCKRLVKDENWPILKAFLENTREEDIIFPLFGPFSHLISSTWNESLSKMEKIDQKEEILFDMDSLLLSKLKKISSIMESNMEGWKNQIKCLENQKITKDSTLKESMKLQKSDVGCKVFTKYDLEFPRQENRYFFGLCPVLLLPDANAESALKACSGCYSVCYSGREAQKKHWKQHKAICKALQPLVRQSPGYHPLHKSPEKATQTLIPYLMASLNRDLTQYEQDLLTYPRLCNAALKNCKKCHCVAYCSTECAEDDRQEHSKSCQLLYTALKDFSQNNQKNTIVGISKYWRPRPKILCQPLASTIEEYFLQEFQLWTEELITPTELRTLTYDYTCQLTALYGAQKADPNIFDKENFVIHVVGARQAEIIDVTRWELFMLELPKLKTLTVVFIGPELKSPYPLTDFRCKSLHLTWAKSLQSGEAEASRDPRYVFISEAYHNFIENPKLSPSIRKPDLVLALNCGFIFYKDWDPTLPFLTKYVDVPLVFTEYYEEDCKHDLGKLDSLTDDELEVVVKPMSNPFCSLLPARIPTGFAFRNFKRKNVVMSNDFICVVKSQSA